LPLYSAWDTKVTQVVLVDSIMFDIWHTLPFLRWCMSICYEWCVHNKICFVSLGLSDWYWLRGRIWWWATEKMVMKFWVPQYFYTSYSKLSWSCFCSQFCCGLWWTYLDKIFLIYLILEILDDKFYVIPYLFTLLASSDLRPQYFGHQSKRDR
jgi:hypothetical protein